MSFFGDLRHTPAMTKPPGFSSGAAVDPTVPLQNLSAVQARMDSLQKFLADSVNGNSLLGKSQMDMVDVEISSAIQQIIVNGAALLASITTTAQQSTEVYPVPCVPSTIAEKKIQFPVDLKPEIEEENDGEETEIIELDSVELLAEHIHFCEICGKGFKRDANLRMHMRAHGNQFKTPEALAKPIPSFAPGSSSGLIRARNTRFSCPFVGCPRNKSHKSFRPLKSAICVKNHFKRSHCPKMYSCNRCNKKSFSVLADLRSHAKHCGETRWKCSCGTSFSRKDKLFGHMALFEGHMPAVEVEEDGRKGKGAAGMVVVDVEEDDSGVKDIDMGMNLRNSMENNEFFGGLLDGFDSMDNYCFQDVFLEGSPDAANGFAVGLDGFFNF